MTLGSTKPLTKNEHQESPWSLKGCWHVRLPTLQPSVSRFSIKCGSLYASNHMSLHRQLRAACCKVVGRRIMLQDGRSRVRFPTKSLNFSIDPILPGTLWPWGHLVSNRNDCLEDSWGCKGWSVLKADNFTAICEPIVLKMWEPRPLTPLWAFMDCYRESFFFSCVISSCATLPKFFYVIIYF
jgi:hypothetical protein